MVLISYFSSVPCKSARTETSKEEDHIGVNKRKTLMKVSLWLMLALYVPPTTAQNILYLRNDWGAEPPKQYNDVTHPVHMVVMKHTGGRYCDNFIDCSKGVKELQEYSVTIGSPDIYCNFLIGGDGNIFEGRGWGVQPQDRNNTVDIVFIGNYNIDEINFRMIDAAKVLMQTGVEKKYLEEDYIVVCHNQTVNTLSPGRNVFNEVQKWDHYDRNLYFKN
ncbi:peptidoglycan recognition protein isoform X2 [Leptinotarsa decemlineata]|uniref:peptidoglycan recognition protein isoform X2 n=1 Tax=Leptinotarsa decemlineata TaxID=7539 RepID=UPI003D308BC2